MLSATPLDVVGPGIVVTGGPSNDTVIADGDDTPSTDDGTFYPNVSVGRGNVLHNFTIVNNGTTDLHISDVKVPDGFTIVQDLPGTIAPGDAQFKVLTIRPVADHEGTIEGTVKIMTDVPGLETYDFKVGAEIVLGGADEDLGTVTSLENRGSVALSGGSDGQGHLFSVPTNHILRFKLNDNSMVHFVTSAEESALNDQANGDLRVLITRDNAPAGSLDVNELTNPALKFDVAGGAGNTQKDIRLDKGSYFIQLRSRTTGRREKAVSQQPSIIT